MVVGSCTLRSHRIGTGSPKDRRGGAVSVRGGLERRRENTVPVQRIGSHVLRIQVLEGGAGVTPGVVFYIGW